MRAVASMITVGSALADGVVREGPGEVVVPLETGRACDPAEPDRLELTVPATVARQPDGLRNVGELIGCHIKDQAAAFEPRVRRKRFISHAGDVIPLAETAVDEVLTE
jgi:hypothetical protein